MEGMDRIRLVSKDIVQAAVSDMVRLSFAG